MSFPPRVKEALAKARETVANALGAKDNEIYFTNGGSESDNWALKATYEAYKSKRKPHHHHKKSSIMRFFIPVSIWKKSAVRKSPISRR